MSSIEMSAVLELSVAERLRLVEAIWEREELDRRWADYLPADLQQALRKALKQGKVDLDTPIEGEVDL